MTETEIVAAIKIEVRKSISDFDIQVIKRDFESVSKYLLRIAVIAKNGILTTEVFKNIFNYFSDKGEDKIKIIGTHQDPKDSDYEILTIEAEINLV